MKTTPKPLIDPCAFLDVETMDLRTSSVLLSIGLCIFDLSRIDSFHTLLEKRSINIFLDVEQQKARGRTESKETMEFWDRPEIANAKSIQTSALRVSVEQSNTEIRDFYAANGLKPKHIRVFSRGPHFDVAKVEDLYSQFELSVPWHFRRPRCIRTWMEDRGYEDTDHMPRHPATVPHCSKNDVAMEAFWMQRINNGFLPSEVTFDYLP